jgi:hypothetical protein
MGNISAELEKSLNRLGIKRQVEAVGLVEKTENLIAEKFPREDFQVVSFNRGTLKIVVASAPMASEMQFLSHRIKIENAEIKRIKILF